MTTGVVQDAERFVPVSATLEMEHYCLSATDTRGSSNRQMRADLDIFSRKIHADIFPRDSVRLGVDRFEQLVSLIPSPRRAFAGLGGRTGGRFSMRRYFFLDGSVSGGEVLLDGTLGIYEKE